jgi:hypothetical protein
MKKLNSQMLKQLNIACIVQDVKQKIAQNDEINNENTFFIALLILLQLLIYHRLIHSKELTHI